MWKLYKESAQFREALARKNKEPKKKQKVQVDPFILKQLMEEIHAAEIAPASGAEGFESANEMNVHRLRT